MAPGRAAKDRQTKEARVLANRYEIVKKLGSGNHGTAFLCKDRECNDKYKVLKEISVGELQPDETVDAMHEAELLSKLDHPGIVKFYDSFIDGEFFCIITEYCEGGDLGHRINEYKRNGKVFDEITILNWMVQLVLAVQYMHGCRVLHRDLKTRNIFIKNNLMKIGDFGISRILMGTTDMASTFIGTPCYMSPEVLKHEGYNAKSDVWSVGCIIYELCTLEHAFAGQSLMTVMHKIVENDPPVLPFTYTKELHEVLEKMLIKDPEKRPSATDVTKFPLLSRHMTKISYEYRAKHNKKPETAEKRASEIAMLLVKKSHPNKIGSATEKAPKDKDLDGQEKTALGKKMTPRERLRQKKLEEANKRAQDLKKVTQIQLVENKKRREEIKTSLEKTAFPVWKRTNEDIDLKKDLTVRDPRKELSFTSKAHTMPGPYVGSDVEDTVTPKTIVRRHSERAHSENHKVEHFSRSFSSSTPSTLTEVTPHTMSMTLRLANPEDKPITPMKDLMVYNKEHSSLDFKDGIPDTPALADTFYDQFSNEFDDEDDDDADVIIADQTNKEKADVLDMTNSSKDDEEDLINYLEMALDQTGGDSTVLMDDSIHGAFGPHSRDIKIRNIRGECTRLMGEQEFIKAYDYLKSARSATGKNKKNEKEIMEGLKKFIKNPSDCFLVDQLLFLEEQAKLS